jgi:hypothetical protein
MGAEIWRETTWNNNGELSPLVIPRGGNWSGLAAVSGNGGCRGWMTTTARNREVLSLWLP